MTMFIAFIFKMPVSLYHFLKVVDVELHRNSLGDDFFPFAPSSSSSSSSSHLPFVGGSGGSSSTAALGSRRHSSPSQHPHDDQPSLERGRQKYTNACPSHRIPHN